MTANRGGATVVAVEELFTSLHRYRTRDNEKSNLEDWLTECLAAVLRSLSAPQWHRLLTDVLGYDPAQADALLTTSLPQVKTQVDAGQHGRPDVVVFVGNCAVIVLENKVAHRVGSDGQLAGGETHQLHQYGQWLRKACSNLNLHPTLVFISHITPAPADFTHPPNQNDRYSGIPRVVESWGGMGRFFLRLTKGESCSLASALAQAFYGMLKDQSMENEFPTTTDISAAQVFLAHESTVRNLVTKMWGKVAAAAPSTNMSAMNVKPLSDYGRYSAYRYVNRMASLKSSYIFIETGLWFPDVGDGWEPSQLEGRVAVGPQVFLLFGSDDDDVFEAVEGRPSDAWVRPYTHFLVFCPLDNFAGVPDVRASAILQWLELEGSNLRRFLLEKQLTS